MKSDHWLFTEVDRAEQLTSNVFDCLANESTFGDEDETESVVLQLLNDASVALKKLREIQFELEQDEERYPNGEPS